MQGRRGVLVLLRKIIRITSGLENSLLAQYTVQWSPSSKLLHFNGLLDEVLSTHQDVIRLKKSHSGEMSEKG